MKHHCMIKYNNILIFVCDLSVQILFWVTVGLSYNPVFNLNEAHIVHSSNNNSPEEVSCCITDKMWSMGHRSDVQQQHDLSYISQNVASLSPKGSWNRSDETNVLVFCLFFKPCCTKCYFGNQSLKSNTRNNYYKSLLASKSCRTLCILLN